MKIQKCSVDSSNSLQAPVIKQQKPTFKGGYAGALNAAGGLMQQIEDWGFFASFLIQDGAGMTAPRVGAAFLRDKEVTGHYNMQEGFEVLGREGLTGPCMMAVAPLMLLLAAKFGKTTSVNSKLIKHFGNSFKKLISKPEFDKTLLQNKDKLKETFYKNNIKELLTNTIGKENVTDELVNKILKEISNYEKIPADAKLKKFMGKSKYRNECLCNITKYINDAKYKASDELNILNKLKLAEKDKGGMATKDTIEALIKYSDDAIMKNKHLNTMDEAAAEEFKNKSIAKRMITNISTMLATLGILAVLPKLYIRSSVSPGARTAMLLKEAKQNEQTANEKTENKTGEDSEKTGAISFKGKGGKSWLSKLGKIISEKSNDFTTSELEYNGHNFTNTLMAGLSLFGLLLPRGWKAYKRAQVDDNGKRDWSEIYEILIRDVSSSLAVVFAVPMLTRLCVTSYENKSGFVLMDKNRSMNKSKTFLDIINPYSKSHVLTNSELSSLYHGVDSTEKMVNFCKYIDKNNGDLEKIISKSEHLDTVFNNKTFKLSDLQKLDKKEKNKKLIKFFEEFGADKTQDKKVLDGMIEKLMKGTSTVKGNKIASFARGLNSIPAVLATFLISPFILGWFIPRLTYANTRRMHEKAEKEKQLKVNAAA